MYIYRKSFVGPHAVLLLQNCNRTDKRNRQTLTSRLRHKKVAYLLDQESAGFVGTLHKQGAQHLYQPFQTIP